MGAEALPAWEVVLWGIFGGVVAEVGAWWSLRLKRPGDHAIRVKSLAYWVPVILMVLSGGGIALMYLRSGFTINPILAFHLGASTPLIARKARESVPDTSPPIDPEKID